MSKSFLLLFFKKEELFPFEAHGDGGVGSPLWMN
jgi:hypothetical protein